MKKALFSILIIIQSLLANSQVDTAIVKGRIHSSNIKSIKIEWLEDNPIYDIQKTYETTLDKKGQFELRIPLSRIAHGRIAYGEYTHYISLMPSDNFFAEIDAETIRYTGKGAEKNNFLFFIETKGYSDDKYYTDYNEGKMPLKEFAIKLADFRDKRSKLLKEYTSKRKPLSSKIQTENKPIYLNEIDKSFIDYFLADNKANYLRLMLQYPEMYAYKNNIKQNLLKVPDEYKYINTFPNIIDDKCVISDIYINAISNLCVNKSMELIKSSSFRKKAYTNPHYIVLFDSLKGKTQEYVLANNLCSNFARDRIDTNIFLKFKQIAKDPFSINTVRLAYNNYNRKITLIRQPLAKEFKETELEDTLGRHITFGKMMQQYKGKVVYLDIWGMYCGPCRALMPATKKLKDKLKDKQIEFVYLSIDVKYKNYWTDAVKVTQTDENHYFLKDRFDAKFMRFMEINWVPCFMIFDKSGRLVDFSAPRPDEPNIESKLLKYATEK